MSEICAPVTQGIMIAIVCTAFYTGKKNVLQSSDVRFPTVESLDRTRKTCQPLISWAVSRSVPLNLPQLITDTVMDRGKT